MPELLNPRREKFCRLYLELGNATEAYRRAGYHAEEPNRTGSRLLTFDDVKKRISELKAQLVFNQSMKQEELVGYLVATIRTPAGEVTPNHPLAQSYEVSDKGIKIRVPDKNQAAAQLARMHGWEAAQRVDVTVDNPLTGYLRALRAADARVIDDNELSH